MATDERDGSSAATPVPVESDDHFEALLAAHEVLVADFYADWCSPCVVVGDYLETVAAETDAFVAEIDVEVNEGLAAEWNVRSLPTVVIFVDGRPTERLVGLQDEAHLRDVVERYSG